MLNDWLPSFLEPSPTADSHHRQVTSLRDMCGNILTHSFSVPNCTKSDGGDGDREQEDQYDNNNNNNNKHCTRDYDMYIPNSACSREHYRETNVLPVVFAIHCFGCTPSVMHYLTSYAEAYNFILIIPHGIGKSFNAQQCCGKALEQNVDDVGFLKSLIGELSGRFHGNLMSADMVYGFGWSNGGYMVVNAAHLFRAIAPVSGYQVFDDPANDLARLVEQMNHRPVGMFLHHSQDDENVAITGCCDDPTMPQCCCRLSNYVHQCQSATEFVQLFGQAVNHCEGSPQMGLTQKYREDRADVTCYEVGTNCWANTTYCIHNHRGHFNSPAFQDAFPMTDEVGDFFARDACENVGGGTWSSEDKICTCTDGSDNPASYCLSTGWEGRFQPPDWMNYDGSSGGGSGTNLGAIGMSIAILLAFVGMALMAREERKYGQFKSVSTFELSEFSVDPRLEDDDTEKVPFRKPGLGLSRRL